MKVFLFFGVLLLFSCNQQTKKPVASADTQSATSTITDTANTSEPDSEVKKVIHKIPEPKTQDKKPQPPEPPSKQTPSLTGIYRTILPDSGSKGIQLTVAFRPNHTYHLEEINQEKNQPVIEEEGWWQPTSGVIWLYKDQVARQRYTWQGDTLVYINVATNKNIPLRKLTSILADSSWRNKMKKGIDFFGVGNEPFWSIEIANEKKIDFQLSEWKQPLQLIPSEPDVSKDSIQYRAANDSAKIEVTIYNRFCSDGMSDFIYDNKVKVTYKDKTYRGCGVLFNQ